MSLNATGEGLLPPPGEAVDASQAEGMPAVAGIVALTLGAVLLFVVLVVLVYSYWPRRSPPPPPAAPESPKKAATAEAGPPPRIPIIVVQPNDDCVLGDLEPSAHPTWKDDLEAGPPDGPNAPASGPPAGSGHLLPGAASSIQGAWGYAPGRAPARKCVVVVSPS